MNANKPWIDERVHIGTGKHTPTPWTTAYGCAYDANGDCVAKADRHESNRLRPTQRDTNIAFIIRAVNAHDALVEALQAYFFATADLIEYAKAYVDARMVDRLTALADDAREALKLAKGK